MDILKRIFCKHDYEYVREIKKYYNLNGDMIYKRCKKCGKLKDGQFMTNEEQQYLFYN